MGTGVGVWNTQGWMRGQGKAGIKTVKEENQEKTIPLLMAHTASHNTLPATPDRSPSRNCTKFKKPFKNATSTFQIFCVEENKAGRSEDSCSLGLV